MWMKSTERHELARNELADWLGGAIKAIKPYVSYGLLAVLVVVAVVWFTGRQRRATEGRELQTAMAFSSAMQARADSPEKQRDKRIEAFEAFLAAHKGAKQERAALSCLAGEYYSRALGVIVAGGDEAATKVDIARSKEIYQRLATGSDPIAAWSGGYDLACVAALEGDKQKAQEMLAATAEKHKGTALGTVAQQRLASLETARELTYAPEPKPEDPATSSDGEGTPPASIAKPDKPIESDE
jgi:predicted negative regulator of RcsB-dependent stress response